MEAINLHYPKTGLSSLEQKVSEGEEIIICKAGKPSAKLIQYNPHLIPRKAGIWKGKITIADDFDAPLPKDILDAFYDESK